MAWALVVRVVPVGRALVVQAVLVEVLLGARAVLVGKVLVALVERDPVVPMQLYYRAWFRLGSYRIPKSFRLPGIHHCCILGWSWVRRLQTRCYQTNHQCSSR